MVIRPSDPEPSRRLPAPGTEASPAPPAIQRESRSAEITTPKPSAADHVVVSSAADQLLECVGETSAEAPQLSPARAKAVLDRLRTGHYDRPEVLDQVARKLQAEIDGPGLEG